MCECVCVSMQELPGVLSVGWYNGYTCTRDSELQSIAH